jgi:hypothetical protein
MATESLASPRRGFDGTLAGVAAERAIAAEHPVAVYQEGSQ